MKTIFLLTLSNVFMTLAWHASLYRFCSRRKYMFRQPLTGGA